MHSWRFRVIVIPQILFKVYILPSHLFNTRFWQTLPTISFAFRRIFLLKAEIFWFWFKHSVFFQVSSIFDVEYDQHFFKKLLLTCNHTYSISIEIHLLHHFDYIFNSISPAEKESIESYRKWNGILWIQVVCAIHRFYFN
jgi:hypothetical protein